MIITKEFLKMLEDESFIINIWTEAVMDPAIIKGHRKINVLENENNEFELISLYSIVKIEFKEEDKKEGDSDTAVVFKYYNLKNIFSICAFRSNTDESIE